MSAEASSPKDANTRDRMQMIARMINEELPAGWGFCLFAFPFGDEAGRCNYVSNGKREDVLKVVSEWITRNGGELEGHR